MLLLAFVADCSSARAGLIVCLHSRSLPSCSHSLVSSITTCLNLQSLLAFSMPALHSRASQVRLFPKPSLCWQGWHSQSTPNLTRVFSKPSCWFQINELSQTTRQSVTWPATLTASKCNPVCTKLIVLICNRGCSLEPLRALPFTKSFPYWEIQHSQST